MQTLFDDEKNAEAANEPAVESGAPDEPFVLSNYTPPTTAENVRRMGLAWSAGVVFGGTIIFMLVLGWLLDLMVGTRPWGIVGGIVLGSIIGFMQFFRITRQIFGPDTSAPAEKPLSADSRESSVRHDPFDEP